MSTTERVSDLFLQQLTFKELRPSLTPSKSATA